MFQRKILLVTLFTLILGSCAHKGTDSAKDALDIEVTKKVLDNGLKILVVENKRLPIYSYYTFFDVGGRYESKGTTGATHFLEHMMFKGAKKYGPGKFDTYIEENGGSTNAYTTFDNTVYYQSLPSHTLEKVIDMEADRLQHLLLEKESFEKERQTVLEERRMRYENRDGGKLYLNMMKEAFKGTPYGGSVIGDKKDVQNLNRDQMMEFFKKFYTPDNAIIVIVGDVDADDTVAMIEKKFGRIPKSKNLSAYKEKMDAPARYTFKRDFNRRVKLHGTSKNPIFTMSYKGVSVSSKESYSLEFLARILGGSQSSYFNQRWVNGKRPKLANIYVHNYNLKNNGIFYVWGELLSNQSMKKFKRDYDKTLRKVCDTAITESTVQKTKNQYLIAYYGAVETNKSLAEFLGNSEFFYGDYKYYQTEIDIINNMTVADVKNSCKRVFKNNKHNFISIWEKNPSKKRR